jgi:hypothetical protein
LPLLPPRQPPPDDASLLLDGLDFLLLDDHSLHPRWRATPPKRYTFLPFI